MSCSRLLVTRWESSEQPVVPLTYAFDTWRVYGILKILRSAHMCQMHQDESAGIVWWPKSHVHKSKQGQCMSDRGVTWFPAWYLKRSQSCIPGRQMHLPVITSTCPSATWTVELEVEEGTYRIFVFDQFIWRPKVDASSCITSRGGDLNDELSRSYTTKTRLFAGGYWLTS